MNIKIKEKLEDFYDKEIRNHLSLDDFLTEVSNRYSEKIAINENGNGYSYKEIESISNRYAKGFLEEGFKKGDKVVLQLPSSAKLISVVFILFRIGIIPIMSLLVHGRTEISGTIKLSETKVYITQDRYLGLSHTETIREVIRENRTDIKVFIQGGNEEFRSLIKIKTNTPIEENVNVDYKDIGLLPLPGGITGISKLIPRRHYDYLYVVGYSGQRRGLTEESVYLAALLVSHNFPLRCPGIMGALFYGGKVVICPTTGPDEIISLIEEGRVTITGLVPATANVYIEFLETDEYDMSSLKLTQTGDPVLDQTTTKKIGRGSSHKLQQIFEIAEGLISTTSLDDDGGTTYNTQGRSISEHDEVLIADEEGEGLPVEEYGEPIARDPYIIYGYYNLDEINKNCITGDCYFKTGDKAGKLKDGDFQIVGRSKEMINRAGEKITPTELGEILLTHGRIVEIQVVGIPDQILGEEIGVFVLSGDNEIALNEIRTSLKEHGVTHLRLPDLVKKVDAWLLTSVGKISKETLRRSTL